MGPINHVCGPNFFASFPLPVIFQNFWTQLNVCIGFQRKEPAGDNLKSIRFKENSIDLISTCKSLNTHSSIFFRSFSRSGRDLEGQSKDEVVEVNILQLVQVHYPSGVLMLIKELSEEKAVCVKSLKQHSLYVGAALI